jgi:hypothetical protein
MQTPITSALESKPDIPDGSVTGFLGTPARKTATSQGYSIWNSSIRGRSLFSADENSVVSLDGSKHAETQVELNKRLPFERWQRSKK